MSRKRRITYQDVRDLDDKCFRALDTVSDFEWGPYWLRCVEFHFVKAQYKEGDSYGWHVHKELQFELPLNGEFEFTLKGRKPVCVQTGQIFVIPEEKPHRWQCLKPGMLLGILLTNIRRGPEIADERAMAGSAGLASGQLNADFLSAFSRNVFASTAGPRRLAAWIYLLIDMVLQDCLPLPDLAQFEGDANGKLTRSKRVVSRLVRFIDANIGGDLSMRRLEDISSLSSRQIQRLFTESIGMSCHQFIMNRRLEIAREKLTVNPASSIKEVAYACGFSSPAHFTTNFKRMYGVSPSHFSP